MIHVTRMEDDEQSAVVSVVILATMAVCIYLAVAVIQWHGAWPGAIGFCVIVPGLTGSALNALVRRRPR